MLDELKKEQEELKDKIARVGGLLKIEDKKKKIGELESQTQDPTLWEKPERAKLLLRELKTLEKEAREWEKARDEIQDISTLLEIATEKDEKELNVALQDIKQMVSTLEVGALLSGKYDMENAILAINAGAGGTDAQDWAQILLRMYSRWAEAKEYKLEIPEISYGEAAGIKSATLVVSGPYAFGYLKTENGIHRLVRISPYSSEGKRHTSFASVEVIPEISEEVEVSINPDDLKLDTFRSSGPGGQNVNKVETGARITHIPTGIVAQSQTARSQHKNRESAMRLLKARLYEMMLKQHKEKIEELRGEKKAIEWGSQIRSYVFHPYTMVKDHRTGTEVGNVQKVIDGDIDVFIEAALRKEVK